MKRKKDIKSSTHLKNTFIFSFISSIICETIAIIYLCKHLLNILNFGIISAVLAILCMVTVAQYITFEEIERVENKINMKIFKINKKFNKDN